MYFKNIRLCIVGDKDFTNTSDKNVTWTTAPAYRMYNFPHTNPNKNIKRYKTVTNMQIYENTFDNKYVSSL